MQDTNKEILRELKKKKTNHVLHLILSIITFGLWLPIWIIISLTNSSKNAGISEGGRFSWKRAGFILLIFAIIAIIVNAE